MNKQLLDEVLSFYNTYGLMATAKYYNCDRTSLWRFFKEYDIKFNTIGIYNKTKEDPKLLQEILEYYKTHSLNQTGKHFNCHKETIKQILLENNIPVHQEDELANIVKLNNKEKFGAERPMQSKEIMEKSKQTCRENYGTDYYLQTEECIENTKQYRKENHDFLWGKISNTCYERYGKSSYLGTQEAKEKAKQYFRNTYGMEHAPQSFYSYKDQHFDSFPELCFYLYYVKNNIKITREPIKLKYIFNNKEYYYIPDFKVNDILYEIKGDQFLNENSEWCCPYDHDYDAIYEAKRQCALKNNVIIFYSKDYQKYVDWFTEQGYKKEDFKFNKFKDKKC